MNTTEKLLKQAYDALKLHFEPQAIEPQKRWKPKEGEDYYYINCFGDWDIQETGDQAIDTHLYATGNCYQSHEKERAIWEQVTRRKYEQALWDAADWVKGEDYYQGYWNAELEELDAYEQTHGHCYYDSPKFATKQSAIDAHTRILGDDAERYFTNKIPW